MMWRWLIMSAVALGGVAHGLVLHVASGGGPGGNGTPAAPFGSVEMARDAIRKLKREKGGLPEPVTVLLDDGIYTLKETLVFTPEDSGTDAAGITYAARPGTRPVISGGRRLTGWRRHDDRLWVADVPWLSEREEPLTQLFVNGQRRHRARTPDAGGYFYTSRLKRMDRHGGPCRGMTFREGDLEPWGAPDDRVVCLFHNWVNSYNVIGEIDWPRRRFTFARPAGVFFLGNSVRYYIENAFEYLDAPGEWFADSAAGRLFYYPMEDENLETCDVIAPALVRTLFRVAGDAALGITVEHLTFRGLSFQHSDADLSADYAHSVQGAHTQAGAFSAVAMQHSAIEDCEFTRVGEHAISLHEACAHNVIRRCHVHDMGGGGVYLSVGAPKRTDAGYLTRHNTVENTFIHDGGHIFRAGCGVFLGGSASHNRILHNEICDLSWMGVHLGWSWTGLNPAYTHHNEVGYNHIHHLGNGVLNDIGGIYTLGVSPGTVLHHNLIHDITRFERGSQGYGGWGIYLDAGSSEIRVENNIVYNTRDGGLHLHCHGQPYGDTIRNNIFAYSDAGQLIRNGDHEPEGIHAVIERNIVYNGNSRMFSGNNWKPEGRFSSNRNCFWSEAEAPDFAGLSLAAWQGTGRDRDSLIVDPGFVDARNGDFRLRPDSPALGLGFEPIDMSAVGLQGDETWRALPRRVTHRVVETAPPPEEPWPIQVDFQEYDPGEKPDGAVAEEEGARVSVVERDPASGRQCMQFEDAPDATPWKPHWYVYFSPRSSRLTMRCSVRNAPDQPATIELEFRDWPRGEPLQTGPKVRFLPDGRIHVADANGVWGSLGTYPLGSWVDVAIAFPQGDEAPATWFLKVVGEDGGVLVERDGLPMADAGFKACNWFGIVGADTEAARFYIDRISLE